MINLLYTRLSELIDKKHSQKSVLWLCSSLRMHRRTSCLEYRRSNRGHFTGTTSGVTSTKVQHTFSNHLNSLEPEELNLSASGICTDVRLAFQYS